MGVLQSCGASGSAATAGQLKSESFPPSITSVVGQAAMSLA